MRYASYDEYFAWERTPRLAYCVVLEVGTDVEVLHIRDTRAQAQRLVCRDDERVAAVDEEVLAYHVEHPEPLAREDVTLLSWRFGDYIDDDIPF